MSDAMHPIVISMYARGFHQLIVHVIQETAMNWWRWTKLPEVGGAVRADVITTHSKPVIPGNVSVPTTNFNNGKMMPVFSWRCHLV